MQKLDKHDYNSFTSLVQMNQNYLHKTLKKILTDSYSKERVVSTESYVYAIGDIPVCLVAHMDTVFTELPINIYYDREENVIWSPQGLGADDRAGVFSILKILTYGYRPHVIFTRDEELGCVGASILARTACPFSDCRFIIELDRAHDKDCVFYQGTNKEFEQFIEGYGFKTKIGSFSDISELCPMWGIAGVNLSIGYYNEHTYIETLNVSEMLKTIRKVKYILDDVKKFDIPLFKYECAFNDYICYCEKCKKPLPAFQSISVITGLHETLDMCIDCAVEMNVQWCEECGEAVLPSVIEDGLCPDCKEGLYTYDGYYSMFDRTSSESDFLQPEFYSYFLNDFGDDDEMEDE